MSLSPRARREKGHAFECTMAADFREIGWDDCITTREAKGGNWCQSDDGIDLCETAPFVVQCKRWKDYMNPSIIEEIEVPPGQIPLLLTKADYRPTMAVLPWEELKKLIRAVYRPRE